jgi:hypothetical protein
MWVKTWIGLRHTRSCQYTNIHICVLQILKKSFINYSSARKSYPCHPRRSFQATECCSRDGRGRRVSRALQLEHSAKRGSPDRTRVLQDNSYKKWKPLIENPWRLILEVVRWAGGLLMWNHIAYKLNSNKPDGSWEGLGRSGKTVAGTGLKAYALKLLLLLMMMMTNGLQKYSLIYRFIRY